VRSPEKRSKVTFVLLVLVCFGVTAMVGAGVGALQLAPAVPQSLETAAPPTTVAVEQTSFSDSRGVELDITREPEQPLTAVAEGRVTSLACVAGGQFESGTSSVAIDGVPLFNLATAAPLWRDLHPGDRGEDVRTIQSELRRLGYSLVPDGVLGSASLAAIGRLLAPSGVAARVAPPNHIAMNRFVWLPATSVLVQSCVTAVGQFVSAGDAIATTSGALTRAAVVSMPTDLAPGERTLQVDDVRTPVGEDGAVAAPDALAAISSTNAYKSSQDGPDASSLSASLELSEPLSVLVVPPSAVVARDGSAGCIYLHTKPIPVQVIGSQLGQTFVIADKHAPQRVDLTPDRQSPCPSH
jgi:peptidoglycan hydrolase-like protein with peptidoglycan-binding domain